MKRKRLLTPNDPHALRINKELAAEIGLNESIMLLQIEYLISIAKHERDGAIWTYQSINDLQTNHFPWWSRSTINRVIAALEERELITIANYNKYNYDRTRWFSLNPVGIGRLKSVTIGTVDDTIVLPDDDDVSQDDTGSTQDDTALCQNDTGPTQDGTTIPETSPEISPKTSPETTPPPPAKNPASRPSKAPTGAARTTRRRVAKPTKEKLSPEQEQVRNRLMHVFLEYSEAPPPTSYAQRNRVWHPPLEEIAKRCDWDGDAAAQLVKDAIAQMNKKGLEMKCPASILTVALGIKRRNGNAADGFDDAWREL